MVVSCPHCGSTNVERQPGLAVNGWKCMKGALIMVGVLFVLPASLTMRFMNVIMLMMIGMLVLCGIFWALWLLRHLFSGKPADWDWECQACKAKFSTAPLRE